MNEEKELMSASPLLITGAAGFIGARLVESFEHDSTPIVSVDHPSYFTEREEHRGIDFGTVVDREELFSWLENPANRPGAIVHLGACTDTTVLDEVFFQRVNVEYSKDLWDYATREQIPLVYASSASTYGAGESGYDDDESKIDQLQPLNPYGDSKQRFDRYVLKQEENGHHPSSWSGFKFFNVYGFGERHKGKMSSVVLQACDQIKESGGVRLFRSHHPDFLDGEQKRDFIAVTDVVRALRFALEKPISRGIYNLGTGKARTFLDLVRAVFKTLSRPEDIEFIDTPISLREHYQYFTEARMDRLVAEGFTGGFSSLEDGVKAYLERLLSVETS